MTKYNVHLYKEMILHFNDIEADTPEEAAEGVRTLQDRFDGIDECDGRNLGALIDVVGDEEYDQSRMIDFEDGRMLEAAPQLLAALEDAIFNEEGNYDGPDDEPEWMTFARQVIAQAKGIKP
jgi:hypothetical protein